MTIYIIEHLETDLYEWCIIEYKHISKIVGKENLWITNLPKGSPQLSLYAKIISESVTKLKLDSKEICILDPEAESTLTTADKNNFKYFIFGGILGDHPPRKRTQDELTKFIPNVQTRNIGKEQMSTDNAVYVVHKILSGTPIEKIQFQDEIEIPLRDGESTIFPYRYALVNGKPLISPELIKYLKNKEDL